MSKERQPFKLLTPKDIAQDLTCIGVHPVVTPDMVDKPGPDTLLTILRCLVEFAYDMDLKQIKAQAPDLTQHAEIWDEAIDILSIFRLSRQLLQINHVEDFTWREVWDPTSKRVRVILSAILNFCRYKEKQSTVINTMKEEMRSYDDVRLSLVGKSGQLEQELARAQQRQIEERPAMWAGESEVQEVRKKVDKLQKQCQAQDHAAAETLQQATLKRESIGQIQETADYHRKRIEHLREQIADDPEGLEREKQDLEKEIRACRGRLEELTNDKRAKVQREQAFDNLQSNCTGHAAALDKLVELRRRVEAARERGRRSRTELAGAHRTAEIRAAEEAELLQSVQQDKADMERAEEAHAERMLALEARRQKAIEQQQLLQAKRTEEQRHQYDLQVTRMELENQVAAERRAHDMEMTELQAKQQELTDEQEAYLKSVDTLLYSYSGTDSLRSLASISEQFGAGAGAGSTAQTLGGHITASPSPAKALCRPSPGKALRSSPAADRRLCRNLVF